jgi:ribosome-associated toxin RatA of RatAB toxin-antitoxin module
MQYIEQVAWFPYSPERIYDFLSDPAALAKVVGRIKSAKVIERGDNEGRLAVELDMPMRKVVKAVGQVKGIPAQELSFKTEDPFPLEFSWKLQAKQQGDQAGTEVLGILGFDLSAYGVPAGGMIVRGIIAGELKGDMERLEQALAQALS